MFLEVLASDDTDFHVGITELQNQSQLDASHLVEIARENSSEVSALQFLAAENIAGIIHLLSAVQNALNAWSGGYTISNSLDVEIILYASAQRQIGRAFEKIGLHNIPWSVAVVIVGNNAKVIQNLIERLTTAIGPEISDPFSADEIRIQRIMKMFDISDKELTTLTSGTSLQNRFTALGRCVTSRISAVAIET